MADGGWRASRYDMKVQFCTDEGYFGAGLHRLSILLFGVFAEF